jgi:hypothetical protein
MGLREPISKSGGDPESMMGSQTRPELMYKKAISKTFRRLNSFLEKQQVLRNALRIRCLSRQLFPSITPYIPPPPNAGLLQTLPENVPARPLPHGHGLSPVLLSSSSASAPSLWQR